MGKEERRRKEGCQEESPRRQD